MFPADYGGVPKKSSTFASQVDGGRGQVPDTVEDVEDLAERGGGPQFAAAPKRSRLGAGGG